MVWLYVKDAKQKNIKSCQKTGTLLRKNRKKKKKKKKKVKDDYL